MTNERLGYGHLEWIADEVVEAGGAAMVRLGRPGSAALEPHPRQRITRSGPDATPRVDR